MSPLVERRSAGARKDRLFAAVLAFLVCACGASSPSIALEVSGPTCPSACPAIPHTAVSCSDGQCRYACAPGWGDGDGDLGAWGKTGCEEWCAALEAPQNPAGLEVTTGAPGRAELVWPRAGEGATAYQVCVAQGGAERCVRVAAALACGGTSCGHALTGLLNGVRATARVRGVNACEAAPRETVPEAGFTAVNAEMVGGDGFLLESTCSPSAVVLFRGELRLDQRESACVTFLTAGDGQWSDGSATVELFIPSQEQSPALAGLVQQATALGGHAVFAGLTVPPTELDRATFLAWQKPGQGPRLGAAALFRLPAATWVTLRLTAARGVFSLEAALPGGELAELIRWPSPLPGAATQVGRPGLAILGSGKVQFRNFRLSTRAALPAPGARAVRYDFREPALPAGWYLRGGTPQVSRRDCPALEGASACLLEGGCAPGPGAGCAFLSRNDVTGTGGTAAFDFPVGIDVARPWTLSMYVAAEGRAFLSPQFLSTSHGVLLEVSGGADGDVVSAHSRLAFPLELKRWHHVLWRFEPGQGIRLVFDGEPTLLPWPEGWDRHPGALTLSSANAFSYFDAWVTDIRISQP